MLIRLKTDEITKLLISRVGITCIFCNLEFSQDDTRAYYWDFNGYAHKIKNNIIRNIVFKNYNKFEKKINKHGDITVFHRDCYNSYIKSFSHDNITWNNWLDVILKSCKENPQYFKM